MGEIKNQGEQASKFISQYKWWMIFILIICLLIIFVFYV